MAYGRVSDAFQPNGWISWAALVQPYMKSLQVYSCPSNTSQKEIWWSGATNAKNHYIANGSWGTPNNNTQSFKYARPMDYADWNNVGTPADRSLARLTEASKTIMIAEYDGGHTGARTDGAIYSNSVNGGMNAFNHLGTSNYLFADGHVKAMTPTATLIAGTINGVWTYQNMWACIPDGSDGQGSSYANFKVQLANREAAMQ